MYQTEIDGKHYELGTSGFLYRSSKLMYDHETKSLWSTLQGKPVVGPLVDEDLQLESLYLVTTTWGEWKARHPDTTVVSLETGHDRDYGEGVAYSSYFGSDELMFEVPERDTRLRNKDQVLALRFGNEDEAFAIAADFLKENPVYQDKFGGINFVVLTDASGANRIYESKDQTFSSWDQSDNVTDSESNSWKATEVALTGPDGEELKRLPAHRAFWFGWYAQFPDTKLVQ